MKQVLKRHHGFWVYFSDFFFQPLKSTIFLLNQWAMRKAVSMVSWLPSQAYCPLHSVALPSWHMARYKADNVLVCHLHSVLNYISFSEHICKHIRVPLGQSFSIYRWSSDRSSPNLKSRTRSF